MPRICNVDGRSGDFHLIRRGPTNSRVQLLDDPSATKELVRTETIRNERQGAVNVRLTKFRDWFTKLLDAWGPNPEWPSLICWALEAEFLREREVDHNYAGANVFMNRDNDDWQAKSSVPEKQSAARLYHICRQPPHDGCLTIGEDRFWLLGYEWPNQGTSSHKCADLVGMTTDGGVVVFEAKLASNSYAPFTAVLEGLDYLACLMSERNFSRILDGFRQWRTDRRVPSGFDGVEPTRDSANAVIVLAPAGYYDKYSRSERGQGWRDLVRFSRQAGECLQFGMAISSFESSEAMWAE